MEKITCSRRTEDGMDNPNGPFRNSGVNLDTYRDDNTCSYCGSFNPETFMQRLEAGDIELGPTDKSYKVYVRNVDGEMFKQSYRDCGDAECKGPDECKHWTTRERNETKFYFQHLSTDQKKRFIELLNEKKIKIGVPHHFYVTPFFIKKP